MKLIFALFLGFCSVTSLIAQPAIQWQNSYGGSLSDGVSQGNAQHDQIEPTSDGGYIIGGYSYSNDGDVTGHQGLSSTYDCWVVKLDSMGNLEWQHSYGGTSDDIIQCIRQTSDGGYIFSANTGSNDGDVSAFKGGANDCWVVKLDSAGNIEWERSLGGSSSDQGRSICQAGDGGFLMASQTTSNDSDVAGNHGGGDIWMVKLDALGAIQWQKCIGGTATEGASTVRLTPDNGFVLAGEVASTDGDFTGSAGTPLGSMYILKTDSVGNIQWVKTYGGSSLDLGREVYPTADGGYVLGGATVSSDLLGFHGSLDYVIFKLDSVGDLEWQNCYGGSGGDWFKSARPTSDGGFVLVGSSMSNDGDATSNYGANDVWVVKLDPLGNIEWQKSFGGSSDEDGTSIVQTADGGYIVGGESESNDFDVSGHHGPNTVKDIWVFKLAPFTVSVPEQENSLSSISISPMPVHSSATIFFELKKTEVVSVGIFDIQGRLVTRLHDGLLQSGSHNMEWEVGTSDEITSGVYFARLSIGDRIHNEKIIVSK